MRHWNGWYEGIAFCEIDIAEGKFGRWNRSVMGTDKIRGHTPRKTPGFSARNLSMPTGQLTEQTDVLKEVAR